MTTPPDRIAPMAHWDDRLDSVAAWCELDHSVDGHLRPRLLGYVRDRLQLVIDLRPFPPGGFRGPFIEAIAGLLYVGCTGVVAALPGRAWSLEDPIPPVLDDADLRQRVVHVTSARRGQQPESVIRPVDSTGGELRWLPDVGPTDDCGWLGDALRVAVERGIDATPDEAATQLARCSALGHAVAFVDTEPPEP